MKKSNRGVGRAIRFQRRPRVVLRLSIVEAKALQTMLHDVKTRKHWPLREYIDAKILLSQRDEPINEDY